MDSLKIRINLDVREFIRLLEIELKYKAQKEITNTTEDEHTEKDEKDEPHVTQFGSGTSEVIERLVESALDRALTKRLEKKEDLIKIKAAEPKAASTVVTSEISQAAVEPSIEPTRTHAKPLKMRWYYLGSVDDICS